MLATLQGDDVILCQITSQARSDAYFRDSRQRRFHREGSTKAVGFARIGFSRRMRELSFIVQVTLPPSS